jgi:CRP/FNR family transcriptional regulator, cyclic AMP receptor protein
VRGLRNLAAATRAAASKGSAAAPTVDWVTSPATTLAPAWMAAVSYWTAAKESGVESMSLTGQAAERATHEQPCARTRLQDDVCRALSACPVFVKTDDDVLTDWCAQLQPVYVPARRTLVAQNGMAERLYVIVSGKAKVCYRPIDDFESVLTVVGPSDLVGAVTLFDTHARGMSVVTVTDVVAVPIERDRFLTWMVEHPEISDQLMRLFARWTRATTTYLVDFLLADAQSRVAKRLLALSQRFGAQEGAVIRVVHDLTMAEMALFAGVSRETTEAVLRDFEDRGWIRLEPNSLVILDAHALASPATSQIDLSEGAA